MSHVSFSPSLLQRPLRGKKRKIGKEKISDSIERILLGMVYRNLLTISFVIAWSLQLLNSKLLFNVKARRYDAVLRRMFLRVQILSQHFHNEDLLNFLENVFEFLKYVFLKLFLAFL